MDKKKVHEKKDSVVEQEKNEPVKVEPKERYIKRVDDETIMIRDIPYKIIENYRDGFNVEELERRYSDFLEKYDYIVVDISDDKARLKGFFREDYYKAPADLRISSLQDYLIEYCNFGCAYYVLERADGKKAVYTSSNRRRSNRGSSYRRKQTPRRPNSHDKDNRKGRSQTKSNRPKPNVESKERKGTRPAFETKASRDSRPVPKKEQTKHVKTVKDNKGKPRFHIRKKKPEQVNK